jgi:phosphatidyl-myo-inositol dimannoside synthase
MLDNEFPPLGGGTGVVNYHVLTELAAHPDIWVDLVTSSRSRATYETERFSQRITLYKVPVNNKNIHHATIPELLRYSWRGVRQCWRLLDQHRYDVSFAFAGVPAGALSYLLKAWNGLPYLVSLQGPDVPGFEERYKALYPFLKPILRRIWANAATVITITPDQYAMAKRTLRSLDSVVIPNGVDTVRFSPATSSVASSVINILCVGRLIERKGQHHLLQAFAQIQEHCAIPTRLTLVGVGDAESTLRQLATRLGIAQQVTFRGVIPQEQMPAIYRESHIFVLPSQNEGISIALLEALASGLPVIVTKPAVGIRLFKSEENGLIVPWADVAALARALVKLVQDEQLRQHMGQNNSELARHFSWPAITQQYLDLCTRAIASRNRQSFSYRREALTHSGE